MIPTRAEFIHGGVSVEALAASGRNLIKSQTIKIALYPLLLKWAVAVMRVGIRRNVKVMWTVELMLLVGIEARSFSMGLQHVALGGAKLN
jgi:hypothetical protein